MTVCKDLQNSISISIPTINGIQALPAPLNVTENSKTLPSTSQNSDLLFKETSNSSIEASQPKKSRKNNETDNFDIKVTEISTAGSSLSTEDDDLYFIGGESRCKMRRLNHRLKKLEERREERRNKLKLAAKKIKVSKNKKIEIDDSDGSTADDEDFLYMVGEAIKKHDKKILKEKNNFKKL